VTSDNSLINPVNASGASVYPAKSFRNLIDPRSIGCDGYEELAPAWCGLTADRPSMRPGVAGLHDHDNLSALAAEAM
jgi:hypothetical protein